MPKPKPKPLTPLIDQIWNLSGDTSATAYSLRPHIQTLRELAEKLELDLLSLSTTPKKKQFEAEIAKLQGILKSQANDFQSEISQLQTVIKKQQEEILQLNTQISDYEKAQCEKKDAELPDIQFQILELLPSEQGGGWLTIYQISRSVGIPMDEADGHLNRLKNAKPALVQRQYNASEAVIWARTVAGNELVLAKREASEKEPAKAKAREHPELAQMETLVLLTVAKHEGMTAPEIVKQINKSIPTIGKPMASLPLVGLFLIKLRGKNLATDGDEPDWGTGRKWVALPDGLEYLAERGLL